MAKVYPFTMDCVYFGKYEVFHSRRNHAKIKVVEAK